MTAGQHRGPGARSLPAWAYLAGVAALLPVGLVSYVVTAQLAALGFFPGWLT